MNKHLFRNYYSYTHTNKYNFNFSKMVIDTMLKFLGYTFFNDLSNGISLIFVA